MVSSTPRPHYAPEKARYPFTGGWMGLRAGLDGRKISSSPGFNPGSSSPQSVTIPTELSHTHTHTHTHIRSLGIRFESSASQPGRFNPNQTDSMDTKRCGSQPLRSSWGKKHILFVRRKRNHNRPVHNQTLYCTNYLAFVCIKNFDLSRSYLTLNMMFQTIKFIDKLLLVSDSDIP